MSQENRLTLEVVKMTLSTALTKAGIAIQELNRIESNIVYNADGLSDMQKLGELIKKAKKAIDEAHKITKAPAKAECDACDGAKKALYSDLDAIWDRVYPEMERINNDEIRRKRENDEAIAREAETKRLIAHFLQVYSQQIAECDSFESLRAVENRVNLEKANKSKYGDLYGEAKSAFAQITDLISAQKEVIKRKVALDKELKDAIDKKNDERAMEIKDEMELLDAKIIDNKVNVLETAINIVVNQKDDTVRQEFSTIDPKRRYWKWEVVNIDETKKKMIEWTKVEPDEDKIDAFVKASKDSWNKDGKDQVIMYGIKFFIDKKLI